MNQVGKYRLVRRLATGGMAEVYLAQADGPAGFQKQLVVKRILPSLASDAQFVQMFLNEARLAARLEHPNIVQIFELGEAGGTYFIAMEHIDGPNLRALCRRAQENDRQLPYEHTAKIISLAAEGLAFAHDFAPDGRPLNLVHRDVSPDNIIVSRNGAVKVVDFGIAKAANQPHLTKTGTLKGKLSYMAPEQIKGLPLDRRADVFSLGVVFYELLAGVKPFDATSEVSAMQAILNDSPAPLVERRNDAPAEIVAVLDRAIAKDRDDRYPDCRAFQADLEQFLITRSKYIRASDIAALVDSIVPRKAAPPYRDTASAAKDEQSVELSEFPLEPTARASSRRSGTRHRPPEVVPEAAATQATVVAKVTGVSGMARRGRILAAAAGAVALVAIAVVSGYLVVNAFAGDDRSASAMPPTPEPVAPAAPSLPPAPSPHEPPVVGPSAAVPESPKARVVAPARTAVGGARTRRTPEVATAARPTPTSVGPPGAGKAPRSASLVIESDPAVEVTIDGERMGVAPVTLRGASPGDHEVVLSDPSRGILRRAQLTVEPGETRRERFKFGQGKIVLRVRPWAQVEVDGRSYGVTPIPPVGVFEGEHKVRLVNAELKADRTLTVRVTAGEEKLVKANLEEAGP